MSTGALSLKRTAGWATRKMACRQHPTTETHGPVREMILAQTQQQAMLVLPLTAAPTT